MVKGKVDNMEVFLINVALLIIVIVGILFLAYAYVEHCELEENIKKIKKE
jgi:uncharacterized membrane protein YidH (DUF202 family)